MHCFDLRHTIVPFSLLRISNIFKEMAPGEIIEIEWTDPEMHEDLLRILPRCAYEILAIENLDSEEGAYRMRFKKTKETTGK